MLNKKLDGMTSEMSEEGRSLVEGAQAKGNEIAHLYETLNFSKALTEVRHIADMANRHFDEKAPWKLIKVDKSEAQKILTDVINIFRLLAIYLKPILPNYTEKVEKLLGDGPYQWSSLEEVFENKIINVYEHIATRVDTKSIEQMVEDAKVHYTEIPPKD